MSKVTYLVESCQWCAATLAACQVDDADPEFLGELVQSAADAGRFVSLRHAAEGGIPVAPCRCRPGMPGPIPGGD